MLFFRLFVVVVVSTSFVSADIKAVIFDCDGVLVDTESLKFQAWQEALAAYGIPLSSEEYMQVVGYDTPHILVMLCQLKGIDISSEVIALRRTRYRELQQGVAPFAPMVAWVRRLASEHAELRLALASSASRDEIQVNLECIGLDGFFEVVVSGRDDLAGYLDEEGTNKPKPYIYLEAAKRLSLPPAECLVFEDTAAGVQAAVGAGMRVIAVPNSYTCQHDFSGAEQVVATTTALQQLLD